MLYLSEDNKLVLGTGLGSYLGEVKQGEGVTLPPGVHVKVNESGETRIKFSSLEDLRVTQNED